ncbi:hypothetical protein [Burkholderia vietnamiensis]|uniref:hypothetical protein n=1 Tax=Burkholderia vietnamiensis TaxID=60552 RepID=UPI000B29FEF2|nr:hypothetical protein [Burkholderia vietnamiensis]
MNTMKRNLPPAQQSLYRDKFALTTAEIKKVAIDTPARVWLRALPDGAQRLPGPHPQDAHAALLIRSLVR